MIKRNAMIARTGNSGYSPGPHLHFHLMDGPNLIDAACRPLRPFRCRRSVRPTMIFIPARLIVTGPPEPAGQRQITCPLHRDEPTNADIRYTVDDGTPTGLPISPVNASQQASAFGRIRSRRRSAKAG